MLIKRDGGFRISHEKYLPIKRGGDINERFTIN